MLIDRDNLLSRIDRCVSEAGKDAAQVMAIRDIKALISVMPEVDIGFFCACGEKE